jgi:glycosyltransferase involved in cell wall biosynthesis
MKVVYINPVFSIGSDPGSDRHHHFAKYLIERGHKVTVLTSAVIYKLAQIRPECNRRWRTVIYQDGIEIVYLWSYPHIRGSFIRRLAFLLTYIFLVGLSGLQMERPDVIYAPNSPGMVGLVGSALSILRRIPLVVEVCDVWPDVAIAMNIFTNRWVIAMAKRLELASYRRATVIVALTRGIKRNIESKGISPEKVVLATNGVDPIIFENVDQGMAKSLRSQYKLENRFVGLYMGAFGHYNSLWTIIEAANYLKDDPRFAFVLIGDGDYKRKLEEMVEQFNLQNIIFIPPISRQVSPIYLAIGDIFLLPNRKGEFYRMNLPNKLFDFLVSGRPIVVAGEGETADVVRDAGAGLIVPAEDAKMMASALVQLVEMDQEGRKKMADAGRCYVLKHYNRETISKEMEQILILANSQTKFHAS